MARPRTISSAEAVSDNQDLLALILLRVPAKTLTQLRAVSKTWHGLISDPQFSSRHALLNTPTKPSALLLEESFTSTHFHYLPLSLPTAGNPLVDLIQLPYPMILNSSPSRKILDSCNGLLLLSGSYSSDHSACVYYIFNPTTHQLTGLPNPFPSNCLDPRRRFIRISLAFDPRRSASYKVVGVMKSNRAFSSNEYQYYVFSSENWEWRALDQPSGVPKIVKLSAGVYCNGAVHWVSSINVFGEGLRIDLDQELLIQMPIFETPLTRMGARRHLTVSNGRLQLVEIDYYTCQVAGMDGNYSRWFLKYRVDMQQLKSAFPEIPNGWYRFANVLVVEGDDDDGTLMVFHVFGKVVSHDLRDGLFKLIRNWDDRYRVESKRSIEFCWHWHTVYPYFESLASV